MTHGTGKTLRELAELVGGRVVRDGSVPILGVNGIDEAGPGEITFLANPRYAGRLATTKAAAVVVGEAAPEPPIPSIVVPDPSLAFSTIAGVFSETRCCRPPGIHPSAVVGRDVTVGSRVSIGPLCVIEDGATIGDDTTLVAQVYVGARAAVGRSCLLYPQVSVREECLLGDRVILHSGVVIGSDGFGYVTVRHEHLKLPQTGTVSIEDDVEIGANTTIDRARFGKTVIRRGTKIDNLVQVAHNVQIGEHSLIAAQVGIAGSTRLDHHVVLAGQVGVGGHLQVGAGVMAAGQSGITRNVPPGTVVSGTPARPRIRNLRSLAELERLSDSLENLRKHIRELESRAASRPQ